MDADPQGSDRAGPVLPDRLPGESSDAGRIITSTFPAESLALATGVFPRKGPSPSDIARAQKLLHKVQDSVKRLLKGEKPEKWEAWQRPPAQEDLHADLLEQLDHEKLQSEELPSDVLSQWMILVAKSRKYVSDKWPIYDAVALEPAAFDLAEDEYGDIWELVRTLDSFDNFLGDLESYVLTREQVEAIQACYPKFYEAMDAVVFECLAEAATRKVELDWRQEDMIRILRNQPDEAPLLSQPAPPPQSPAPAKPTTPAQQEKRIQQTRPTAERIEADQAE